MRLYVGNVPWSANQDDLLGRFSTHGPVREARIITDRETGRSRGFAFVTYENTDDGQDAIEEENGADFMGRTLRVSEAQERSAHGGGNATGQYVQRRMPRPEVAQTPPLKDRGQEPRRRRNRRSERHERD